MSKDVGQFYRDKGQDKGQKQGGVYAEHRPGLLRASAFRSNSPQAKYAGEYTKKQII